MEVCLQFSPGSMLSPTGPVFDVTCGSICIRICTKHVHVSDIPTSSVAIQELSDDKTSLIATYEPFTFGLFDVLTKFSN